MTSPLGAEEVGNGPPLLAVHGGLLGGRLTFSGVAPRLGAHHRVIVVDRPGFEGTPDGADSDVPTQARRLLTTIQERSPDEPVHALGVSFGGLVVLRAVQEQPSAFASLTLVETPAEDLCPPDMVHPVRFGALVRRTHEALPDDPEALAGLFAQIDGGLWRALSPRLTRHEPGVTALRSDLAIWDARLDRHALADAVGGERPIPVLTVSGSTSDPAFRTFGACSAAALAGRHVVIQGAGHAAHLHPDFVAILLDHTGAA